jgi:hypothetical protein
METDWNEVGQRHRSWWFHHLRDIGDIDLQRQKWLDPTNTDNPHWSYIEFVCCYPDWGLLEDAEKKSWLTVQQTQILRDFKKILLAHKAPKGDYYDNAAVLNDPAWHQVVKAAQTAVRDLLVVTTDAADRATLLGQK